MCREYSSGGRPIRGTGGAQEQKLKMRYKMSCQYNLLIYKIIQALSVKMRYKI